MSQNNQVVRTVSNLITTDLPPNPEWISPSILPKKTKLLFGGHAKVGKSFILLSLARALSLAERPFECPLIVVPKPVKVLIIEQELGDYGLQERVRPIFKGVDLTKINDLLFYASKQPRATFSTLEGRDFIKEMISQVEPNVVMCDPMGKMHFYDENSNTEISKLWLAIDHIIKDFEHLGLSFIISHHFGKPIKDPSIEYDKLDPYNFRGASKWYDDPDTLATVARMNMLSGRDDAWRIKMQWFRRFGKPMNPMWLTVNRDKDLRVLYEKELASGDGTREALSLG